MLKSLLLLPALLGTLGVFAASDIAAEVEYFYAKDGTIIGRAVNGVRSDYEYDAKGQLLAVKDAKTGELREKYTYDPAGNILSKTVYGKTTTYTYDGANQLINANTHDTKTSYAYDAAGRLIRAGSKSYRYGFKDKVLEVRDGAKTRARFSYYMDGQLRQAKYADRTETFMWDGLALVKRDSVNFINEPHATGGNPVLAGNSVMFNDMLGSTLAVDGKRIDMTAFGDSNDPAAMFTGKPQVEELGHVFLFRNYRAELGKWQTADPLGYPDGWNNLAYCKNGVVEFIDFLGGLKLRSRTIIWAGVSYKHTWLCSDDGRTTISGVPSNENYSGGGGSGGSGSGENAGNGGAEPANLVYRENYAPDLNCTDYDEIDIPLNGRTESEVINDLKNGGSTYNTHPVPYGPMASGDAYNSNSLLSGLLNSRGFNGPDLLNRLPGFPIGADKPIPMRLFE